MRHSKPHSPDGPRRVFVVSLCPGRIERDLFRGIRRFLSESGSFWDLEIVRQLGEVPTGISRILELHSADGVMLGYDVHDQYGRLYESDIPLVCMEFSPGAPETLPRRGRGMSVLETDVDGLVQTACAHFLSQGVFRDFGYVEAGGSPQWSVARGDAYEKSLKRHGFSSRRFAWKPDEQSHGVAAGTLDLLSAWLRGFRLPAAILAANDETAQFVLFACRRAGLAVPRSVAVLGIDNEEVICENVWPNLSSIDLCREQTGYLAAQELAALMESPGREMRLVALSECRLVRRSSTANASAAGAMVQRAIDYIEANACAGRGAADVVRALGVSRSLLERRFRELCGESLLQAIRRRRVDEARRLLLDSDAPIDTICIECGYREPNSMRAVFRAHTGMSMRAYRARKC